MLSHIVCSVALVRDGDCRPSDVRTGEIALEAAGIRCRERLRRRCDRCGGCRAIRVVDRKTVVNRRRREHNRLQVGGSKRISDVNLESVCSRAGCAGARAADITHLNISDSRWHHLVGQGPAATVPIDGNATNLNRRSRAIAEASNIP